MTTLTIAFKQKYPTYASLAKERFQEATNSEFCWENLTKANLANYVSYLRERVAPSTVKNYASMLKSVMSLYDDEYDFPKGWKKILTTKSDTSQQIYLTEEDIKRIIEHIPETTVEEIVKTRFLLGCITGARYSDYIRFSRNNICGGFLRYVSQKTHTETTVPIAPILADLIDKARSFVNIEIAESTFNRVIRRICEFEDINDDLELYKRGKFITCEKWEAVSSHTARRSFATNLYLRGADIITISRLMGHSSIEMTSRYICCGFRELSPEVQNYFNQFQ